MTYDSQAQENSSQTPTADQREEMSQIISELRKKMLEIDRITEELEQKRKEFDKGSPTQTKKILEEIKVPPLELLK